MTAPGVRSVRGGCRRASARWRGAGILLALASCAGADGAGSAGDAARAVARETGVSADGRSGEHAGSYPVADGLAVGVPTDASSHQRFVDAGVAADAASAADAGADAGPAALGPRVVFASNRTGDYDLYAARLDGSHLERLTDDRGADLYPAVAPHGASVAFTSSHGGRRGLWLLDLGTRQARPLVTSLIGASAPSFSPDGATIAFEARADGRADTDIFTLALASQKLSRLTSTVATDAGPCFSPDGATIYFVSSRSGQFEVWSIARDGSNPQRITTGAGILGRPAVLPSGRALVFARRVAVDQGSELVELDLATSTPRVISSRNDSEPAVSADGALLVFTTLRYGGADVVALNLARAGSDVVRVTAHPALDGMAVPF